MWKTKNKIIKINKIVFWATLDHVEINAILLNLRNYKIFLLNLPRSFSNGLGAHR